MTLDSRWLDEQLGNWVSDFLIDDAGQKVSKEMAPHAGGILKAFITAACEYQGNTADQLGEDDIRHSLLDHLPRLDLPLSIKSGIPEILRGFVEDLGQQGRLAESQTLSALIHALTPEYLQQIEGKTPTLTRAAAKICRNDPCPCGSGKKYKKCCLNLLDS